MTQIQTEHPPSPPRLPILGNILNLAGGDTLQKHLKLYREYGDITFLQLGPLPAFVLANPEHVHHVLVKNQKNYDKGMGYDGLRLLLGQGLVTSEGELWRTQRRLMQPKFTPKATVQFNDLMVEIIEQMLERWQPVANENGTLQIDQEMIRLTMSIISKAVFGLDLDEELQEVGQALRNAFSFIPDRSLNPVSIPLSVPLPKHRQFKDDMAVINQFLDERIAIARESGEQDTLLGLLLAAQDEETGLQMDEQQLRDEVITIFFAGFETTARSLTWGWYLLAQHAEVMEKLTAESDEKLQGRSPTIADLYNLTYTRMVVDETLRIYPPTALLARQNIEDDEIGGYHIPAGSLITLVPYLIHRHPSVWDDPERFDPERFTAEAMEARPKYAYIPFASGPRVCLGNNFALLEMTLTFAMVVARYRLTAVSNEKIEGTFRGTYVPTKPLTLKISNR